MDIPLLRSIESAVCADFDLGFGSMIAGSQSYFVSGGNVIVVPNPVGLAASSLTFNSVGMTLVHPLASESGTIFISPSTQVEFLNSAINPNVTGSFSANQVNYLGLDLLRTASPLTSDSTAFLPANAAALINPQEIIKVVPTGRLLNYQLIIQTATFSSTSNVLPIAIVVTDANNNVVSVEDARPMLYRLGSGGDSPNPSNRFPWSSGRLENPITFSSGSTQDPFQGGDKQIGSLKSSLDAIMTRLQEIGGGNFWYSPTSNANIKLLRIGSTFTDADQFQTTSNTSSNCTLSWQGLYVTFDSNLGADNGITNPQYNNIVQITDNPSGVTIQPGQCLYVDVNRADTTFAALTGKIINLDQMIQPGPPYTRFVIAWAELDQSNITQVYTRDAPYKVGTVGSIATSTAYGTVELNAAQVSIAIVPSIDASTQNVIGAGLSRGNSSSVTNIGAGNLLIGDGTDDTNVEIGSGSNTIILNAATVDVLGSTTVALSGATVSINTTSTKNTNIGTGTNTGTTTIGNSLGGVTDINSPVVSIGVAGSGTTALEGNNLIGDHTASITTVQGAQLQLGNSTQVTQTHFVDTNQAGVVVTNGSTSNTSATADSLFNCTDHSGVIDVVVGGGGITVSGSGGTVDLAVVTFSTAFANTPIVIGQPFQILTDSTGPNWPVGMIYFMSVDTGTKQVFKINGFNNTAGTLTFVTGTYKFSYQVIGK